MVRFWMPVGVVALLIAAVGTPLIAHSEDIPAPKGVVISLDYSKGEFSGEFVDFVARYGARTPVAYSGVKLIRTYVVEVCGAASATNERLFTLAIQSDGGTIAEDGSVKLPANATDLMLPSCLPTPVVELTPRIAVQDTTFYEFFRTDNAGATLFGSDVLAQASLRDSRRPLQR